MLFNSLEFIAFLLIVVIFYYILPHVFRGWLLIIASFIFYASWNLKYIVLILTTIITAYSAGVFLNRIQSQTSRKYCVALILIVNFGLLAIFKYFNFFIDSSIQLLKIAGFDPLISGVNFLLPVGISFYTFQAVGYVLDVYRDRNKYAPSIKDFALYISFFPQLVAGPIERSWRLLPQFRKKVEFDLEKIKFGSLLILWGFFKKLVIADRLALYTDSVFASPGEFAGAQLALGTYLFAFQIYCDFSGYTNIAIGTARILGINLMMNFDRPYFAKSIQDFWRRWHISLSTWFRDYLYIPLGGSKHGRNKTLRNVLIVFLICGLWHGANWTFVVWGGLHGVLLVTQRIWTGQTLWPQFARKVSNVSMLDPLKIFLTFNLICFTWIFFRAQSLSDAFLVIRRILFNFQYPENLFYKTGMNIYEFNIGVTAILILITIEFISKGMRFDVFTARGGSLQTWTTSYFLFFAVLIFGVFNLNEFIYFQF